jgi:hypothetical protein
MALNSAVEAGITEKPVSGQLMPPPDPLVPTNRQNHSQNQLVFFKKKENSHPRRQFIWHDNLKNRQRRSLLAHEIKKERFFHVRVLTLSISHSGGQLDR